jgi:predicted RNase H-like HicB family nuclease
MKKTKFVYYQEDDFWIGWLEEYPDYRTQGKSLAELEEHLKDIYDDLTGGKSSSPSRNRRRVGKAHHQDVEDMSRAGIWGTRNE